MFWSLFFPYFFSRWFFWSARGVEIMSLNFENTQWLVLFRGYSVGMNILMIVTKHPFVILSVCMGYQTVALYYTLWLLLLTYLREKSFLAHGLRKCRNFSFWSYQRLVILLLSFLEVFGCNVACFYKCTMLSLFAHFLSEICSLYFISEEKWGMLIWVC